MADGGAAIPVCIEGYLSWPHEKGMGQWLGEALATRKEP